MKPTKEQILEVVKNSRDGVMDISIANYFNTGTVGINKTIAELVKDKQIVKVGKSYFTPANVDNKTQYFHVRKKLGYTKSYVSLHSGVCKATIKAVEEGRSAFKHSLIKLNKFYNAKIKEAMGKKK